MYLLNWGNLLDLTLSQTLSSNRIGSNASSVNSSASSNDEIDKLFELMRTVNELIKKESIIEAQANVFKALREYPQDAEIIFEDSLNKLKGEGVNLSGNNIFLKVDGKEPIRLGNSLWLCHSYNLPTCIKDKVDKSYNGFYLLDTKLIDPDERFNSNGIVRLLPKKEYKLADLKENEISPESRFDLGHKAISSSSYSINITEPVSAPVQPVIKPVEKSPLETLGLSLPGIFNSLKAQLQDPLKTNKELLGEFKKTEDLLLNRLKVNEQDFRTELINTMCDFLNSPETGASSIIDRQAFFFAQKLYGQYRNNVIDRVNNDINTSGAVTKDDVSLIKDFDITLNSPIYKNHIIDKAKSDLEFDLKDDSNKNIEDSVRAISKFIYLGFQESVAAGAEKSEFGKAMISTLLEVANSSGISELCLNKCQKLGERYHLLNQIPKSIPKISTAISKPVIYIEPIIEQVLEPASHSIQQEVVSLEESVLQPVLKVETPLADSKFPLTYADVNAFTPLEISREICSVLQDELLTILDSNRDDKRIVALLDGISAGKPLEIALRDSAYGLDVGVAKKELEGFFSENKIDPNLSRAILVSDRKIINNLETEIKCLPENMFGLIDEDGNINSRGHLISISSEVEGVNLVYEENQLKGMEVTDYRIREKDELESQQNCLDTAIDMLKNGDLIVYGSKKNNGLIKLEVEYYKKDEKQFLACLHPNTNSRIWGIYTPSSGKMVFKGICADHDEWSDVINAHKKEVNAKVVA